MLKQLEGSFAIDKIDNRRDTLDTEYDSITRKMPEFRRFTRNDFYWARTAVVTRIFGFSVRGKSTSGLVPMADMLNHTTPAEVLTVLAVLTTFSSFTVAPYVPMVPE